VIAAPHARRVYTVFTLSMRFSAASFPPNPHFAVDRIELGSRVLNFLFPVLIFAVVRPMVRLGAFCENLRSRKQLPSSF
jgi:hypothetical protein